MAKTRKKWTEQSVREAVAKTARKMIENKGVINMDRLVWQHTYDAPYDNTIRRHCGMSRRELLIDLYEKGEVLQLPPEPNRERFTYKGNRGWEVTYIGASPY